MGIMDKKENIKWSVAKDQIAAAKIIGQNISADFSRWADIPILLMLSGGSALNILEYIETEDWSNITLFLLDERYSVDNADSNFAQLAQFDWLTHVTESGAKFIDSRVLPSEDLDSFTQRLADSLNNWLETNPGGKKLAIMGMGPDGHVAGIFPYPEDPALFTKLFCSNKLIVSHNVFGKNKFPQRVTTTFSFFDLLDKSYVYICGEEKRKALVALRENKQSKHELPAGIIYNMKEVLLVTDINF
jgi:6-phosphogluconolactonase/glucosamine-6-phosphate isomerase/deaminase